MPRVGKNPNRGHVTAHQPARITLAVLTYLPDESGYFQNRFEVTRLCLESLIANTPRPYDLIVFDNGSGPKLVTYLEGLRAAGHIHYLILAGQNVGKPAALQVLFQLAPGEIVAYTDDDIFFMPGWLEAHLRLLETYPRVGMATGFYIRAHMSYAVANTLAFADRDDVHVERGLLNADEWERHYRLNMDRSPELYARETEGLEDVALTYQGVEAFVSAGHHQFVARREVLLKALPQINDGRLMGRMIELDTAIDQLGYLRLSTREPVTRLLGNLVDEAALVLARQYNISVAGVSSAAVKKHRDLWHWAIQRSGRVRAWTYRFYNYLFEMLNTEK